MSEIAPECGICEGGCCKLDATKIFGIMKSDLLKFASYNLVVLFPPGLFPDLLTLYTCLRENLAPDGLYAIQNGINDIDGIKLGPCGACIDGK